MSLAAALVQLSINLYLTVRLVMVRLPPSFRIRSMVTALEGPTIRRASSVLVLNIVTLIPNAMKVNMLAQFLPFSIGALVVLGASPCLQPVSASHVLCSRLQLSSESY